MTHANLPVRVELAGGDEADVERGAADRAERVHHLVSVALVARQAPECVELVRERRVAARRTVLDGDAGVSWSRIKLAHRASLSESSERTAVGSLMLSFMNAPRPSAPVYCGQDEQSGEDAREGSGRGCR